MFHLPFRFIKCIDYQHQVEKVFVDEKDPEIIINVLSCVLNILISDLDNPEEVRAKLVEKIKNMPL